MLYNQDEIKSYIETQLSVWPTAKQNYDNLVKVQRRKISINGYDFFLQLNPARIVSTGADVNKTAIEKRPCFLCSDNRPSEQFTAEIIPGWDMLVNPFPILPVHLTIVSTVHQPQKSVPKEIVELATLLPGMAIFFNGAKAGASAPDHLHLQAVLKDELPLIRLVEKIHPESIGAILPSDALLPSYPYFFFSGVVKPDESGLKPLLAGLNIGGSSAGSSFDDHELVNTFFWIGSGGTLRFISVPRKAHRPSCYYAKDDSHRLISPGCIDMAGLIIAPQEEDFLRMSAEDIVKIYKEVAFEPKK